MSEVLLVERLRDIEQEVKERTSGIKWAVVLSLINLGLNFASTVLLYMIYLAISAHGIAHAAGAAASSGTQQIAVIGGGAK